MTGRRGLPAATLLGMLATRYGIRATAVHPQPGGQDHGAWVYRVRTDPPGPGYIAKVRRPSAGSDAVARVASSLRDAGVPHVVAPVRSACGAPTVNVEGLSLTVFPRIESRTGVEVGLTDDQWRMLGVFARTLHELPSAGGLASILPRARFRPREIDLVRRVDRAVETATFGDPVAREIAAFWAGHRRDILDLADRTGALGREVRRRRLPLAVSHGDLHTWNVLVDTAGELWVIDWDELLLAPRERDLMFFVGGISTELVSQHATACFLDGYGDVEVDEQCLAYYRHAWATQDIGSHGARVLLDASLDQARCAEAASILLSLFRPGEILDLAMSSRPHDRAGA